MSRSVFSFIGRWFPKFQSSSSSDGGMNVMHFVIAEAAFVEALKYFFPHEYKPTKKMCDMYHNSFQKCVNAKGIDDGLCQVYKHHLLSDCNAVWDGTTIQYPVKNGAAHKNKT